MKRLIPASLFLVALTMTTSCSVAGSCDSAKPCRIRSNSPQEAPVRTPEKLKSHTHDSRNFEALMPLNTVDQTVESESLLETQFVSEGTIDATSFQVRVLVPSPIDLGDEITRGLTDNFVTQARNQQQAAFGTAVADKAIEQHGMRGNEFTYFIPANRSTNGDDVVIKRRVMFNGTRLFIATVTGSEEVVNSRAATQFLDSVQQPE